MSSTVLRSTFHRGSAILGAIFLGAPLALLGAPQAMAGQDGAAGTTAGAAAGTTYYVSCGEAGGDGSAAAPFGSLEQANGTQLAPGDQLLFRRGSTCAGTLKPHGSGSQGAPVVIGAYGSGQLPVLDGAGSHDTVLLENIEHVTVQDLDIVNAANPGTERNGVRLVLKDFGQGSGYLLQNLSIHDVRGGDSKGLTGSSGIQVTVTGGTKASWYNDLRISNNQIYDVDREGIYFKSTWNKRPEVGGQDYTGLGPWTPSTGVVVSGNKLNSIAGDGIKLDTTTGAVVRDNTLAGFQLRSAAANAGIWTFNADDTIVSGNDVSGGGNSRDGMSFDADGGSQRTVFEYNYSHDNAGGLLLLCPYSGAFTHGTVMRYNVSHNDGARIFQLCPGDIQQTEIYNNTIVNDAVTPLKFLQDDNSVKRQISWRNNVVVNRGTAMSVDNHGPSLSFDHNAMTGVGQLPANGDGSINPGGLASDPGLLDPAHTPSGITDLDGFRLRTGSPALGSGAVVANNGGRDFFGNPVSPDAAPNMGAYQGPGVKDNARPASVEFTGQTLNTPPGTAIRVNAEMHWWSNSNTAGVRAELAAPEGWTVTALETQIPANTRAGDTVPLSWLVTPAADAAPAAYQLSARVLRGNSAKAETTTNLRVSPLFSNLAGAFDRVAITDDANPGPGQLAASNSSLSAQALQAAKGIAPGAQVKGSAVTYTWPSFAPGTANAVRAEGQNIAVHASGAHLGFVLFGINGSPAGTGKVAYTDGSTQDFPLAAGDYYYNKAAAGNAAFATMGYRNIPAGQDRRTVTIFESGVTLDPAKTVAYVTLPQLPAQTDAKSPGMIILAMAIGS